MWPVVKQMRCNMHSVEVCRLLWDRARLDESIQHIKFILKKYTPIHVSAPLSGNMTSAFRSCLPLAA